MLGYGFGIALWYCVILYVPLWIILCDTLIQHNWVVSTYNFVCVFYIGKNRVVKLACSSSDVLL
jgi:hypothetical protein